MNGSVKMISDIITQLNDAKLDGTTGAYSLFFTLKRSVSCWKAAGHWEYSYAWDFVGCMAWAGSLLLEEQLCLWEHKECQ